MAKITFPRKEFESYVKITPEIETKINLFGTPLEFFNNEEVGIEIFPNRPDLLSLYSYLPAFKSFLGKESGIKTYKIMKPEKDYYVKVEKEVKEVRPYTQCMIVKNIKLNEIKIKEIISLQEKLHNTVGRNRKKMAIGIYPLDKIKLPIIYTAKKPEEIIFMPLGSEKEMNAKEILLLHPTGQKYASLLNEKERYPVFIDSSKNILSMPPIINSESTGRVNVDTTQLFIECSGSDKITLEKTIAILARVFAEIGGSIYQMEIKDKENSISPNLNTKKMKISIANLNSTLGINLEESELPELLAKMGHDYKKGIVEISAWRSDITNEVDIIEDIAIAYGYDKFIPVVPLLSTIGEESRESIIQEKIRNICTGIGMIEISTYHLIKQNEESLLNTISAIEVSDSKTDYKFLRPNLLIPMLRIIAENKDEEYPQSLFEIGRVFKKNGQKETGIEENDLLCISLTPANVTHIKQRLDFLMRMLGLEYTINETIKNGFIEGRTGEIICSGKSIGIIGELHPTVLKSAGIRMPLAIVEIEIDLLYKLIK